MKMTQEGCYIAVQRASGFGRRCANQADIPTKKMSSIRGGTAMRMLGVLSGGFSE